MNQVRVTAKSYDEAVTNALLQLQTTSDHIEIKVIEEGTDGLFGILGGKPWVIEATEKEENEQSEQKVAEEKQVEEKKAEVKEETKEEVKFETKKDKPVKEEKKETAKEETAETKADAGAEPEDNKENEEKASVEITPVSEEKAAELMKAAESFLTDVFEKMELSVKQDYSFDFAVNEVSIILSGDDMGVLIGKRGQTLDSIQYLASLVVNKLNDSYIRVKVDTENYRERRQEKLEQLAYSLAAKAKKNRRKVELEPMNPYERRIIHAALQSDSGVTTTSEGEDPYRHVIIIPKREAQRGGHRRHK